jgi:hypothetical protein
MKSRNPTPHNITESTCILIVLLRYPDKRLSSHLRIRQAFCENQNLYYSISYALKEVFKMPDIHSRAS